MTKRILCILLAFLFLGLPCALAEEVEMEPIPEDEEVYQQILDTLDNELYLKAYQYLQKGGTLKSGLKGDAVNGLQQLIVQLGEETNVNGAISSKTIAALNEAQKGFGLKPTKEVELDDFKQLLICALFMFDAELAGEALYDAYSDDQLEYFTASAFMQQGRFFSAMEIFEYLFYLDSEERAAACEQDWPKNGQVYRNKKYKASQSSLEITASMDDGEATYLKIYTVGGELVSGVFIAGSESATVKLPGGTYTMKVGTGSTWYGPVEAFGNSSDAYYATLVFGDNGSEDFTLPSGEGWSLTLGGVYDGNVDSEYEDWSDF